MRVMLKKDANNSTMHACVRWTDLEAMWSRRRIERSFQSLFNVCSYFPLFCGIPPTRV